VRQFGDCQTNAIAVLRDGPHLQRLAVCDEGCKPTYRKIKVQSLRLVLDNPIIGQMVSTCQMLAHTPVTILIE
jgi:hypothetical protein